jgi:SNF2 family DNA or RNA helicase
VTFGTITRKDGFWIVKCDPHVRARMKRVFPRMPKAAADTIKISDSAENSLDLLWFVQRYPMDVKDLDGLKEQARQHLGLQARLADLLAGRSPPPEMPLAVPAREYQLVAAQALVIRRGMLLADDVGLGKSISAICPMVAPDHMPVLVVCPTHMPKQWKEYLNRFAPQLRVHIVKKGTPYPLVATRRQADLWRHVMPDVLITNYHKLRGWAETLASSVRYVVFDEAQQLRNPDSDIYRACVHVSRAAQLRIGLSATPIYNYGNEFFYVIDALMPGALGSREEFVREWCSEAGEEKKRKIKNPDVFGSYLRREGIMLRRTRAEVGRELPPLTKIAHTIEADADVLSKLTGDAIELARLIVSRNESFRGQQMQAAGEFDAMMRQATGVAKAPYVAEFVRILVENGEKVLLFGWHHEVYGIWRERLADLKPVFYTGVESTSQKESAKEAFIKGESKVLAMSLRSGAGIDGLQGHCSVAVFGELDWSPGVHEQCIGRIWRDGQENACVAYYLMSEDGSDPIIADVLGVKREQIEGVRNPEGGLIERVETGEHQIRKLAQQFLNSRGVRVEVRDKVAELEPA